MSCSLHAALNQKRNIFAIVEQLWDICNMYIFPIDFDLCMKQKNNNKNNNFLDFVKGSRTYSEAYACC